MKNSITHLNGMKVAHLSVLWQVVSTGNNTKIKRKNKSFKTTKIIKG